jgi:hypothetical protein
LIAGRHQRAGNHSFKRLDANRFVKADFSELGQAIRIIGIGLVECLVQYRLRVPRFNTDRRHPLGRQRMIEPRCQWPCFEDDAPGVRRVLADNVSHKLWVRKALSPPNPLPVLPNRDRRIFQ